MRQLALVSLLVSLGASQCYAQSVPTPPGLEYLFTATVNLGEPLNGIKTLGGGVEVCKW